ncbi:MAG TPA: M20 family metallopeptidase [Thermoanaerobaculia bacterium]|nr:M20 family metallopeptidase [Thermoanaerobaculia bacterium]
MKALSTNAAEIDAAAVALRRALHARPETAFEEVETAALAAGRMRARGLPVRTGVGKTGVAAVLDTGRPGRTVLLRADLDALPLAEKTGLPWAATNGRMHACGHDGHVAALDAAADLLLLDPPACGRVVFAFQPAEEGAGGAAAMIADGVLDDPRPDAVFGIHIWTALPLGRAGVARGAMMAAVDEFRIDVTSPGGHAASPHETRDAVVAAAHVVTALQTVVARRLSPLEPAVVSVTSVHGGSAFNVLPASVTLSGTCRSFDAAARDRLAALVPEVAAHAAAALGCGAKTDYRRLTPALVNHPAEADRARRAAAAILGEEGVTAEVRTMGGEDFAEFLLRVPGAFAFVGAARPDGPRGPWGPHHAPDFDFDERALGGASRLLAAFARDALAAPV